jgi:Mg2+ and Co2+ transporter CorA
MVEDNVDLGFIANLLQKTNDEVRGLRKEVADIRTLSVQTYDYVKRTDRRHTELRDDLELMIKMEIGGAITHVQTVLENNLSRIEEKVDNLSGRMLAFEGKL